MPRGRRSCQLVAVVGEPGVGKSRLCAELFREVEDGPGLVRWRQGRCLPYGDGISFWPLGEIVKAECGILESDSPAEAAAKLALKIPETDPERGWLLARLAPLVGAPAEPASLDESFAAWRRFCESLAAERTTVLVFEDLHWADDALLTFIEHLADWVAGVPLLLLCTARPELYERHPTFGANARNAQRINLDPLSDAETGELVSGLLERVMLPAATRQQLLERAGGNPLYAEEFVRLLADRGDEDAGTEVPDSVQAIIAARLDTLPADRKSLLQDAAVVGKVFWAGALAAMGDRDPSDVTQALHELARKELVRPVRASSMAGEQEYTFWHALVRDVCYAQIPRLARAARHQAAAAWIELAVGERVADLADVLAYHYLAALELHEAAGDREQQADLRAHAVRSLGLAGARALVLDVGASRATAGTGPRARARGCAGAGVVAGGLGAGGPAAGPAARGRGRRSRRPLRSPRSARSGSAVGRILTRLGIVRFRLADPRAGDLIKEAVEVLEAEPVGAELVSAYAHLAGYQAITGHAEEAIEAADRASALSAELGLPEPAFALHFRGLARTNLGDAEGIDDLERALRLGDRPGPGTRDGGHLRQPDRGHLGGSEGPGSARERAGGDRVLRGAGHDRAGLSLRATAWPSLPTSDRRRRPSRRSSQWPRATRRPATRTSRRREYCRRACSRNAERRVTPSTWTPSSPTFARSGSRAGPPTAVVVGIQSLARPRPARSGAALEADLARLVAETGPSSMPTCFRRRFGPCSSSATSRSRNDSSP